MLASGVGCLEPSRARPPALGPCPAGCLDSRDLVLHWAAALQSGRGRRYCSQGQQLSLDFLSRSPPWCMSPSLLFGTSM